MCGLFLLARIVVDLSLFGVFYGVTKTLVVTTRLLSTLQPVPAVSDITPAGAQCLIFEYQHNTWEM